MDQEKAAELIEEGKFEESADVFNSGLSAISAFRSANTAPLSDKNQKKIEQIQNQSIQYGEEVSKGHFSKETRKSLN